MKVQILVLSVLIQKTSFTKTISFNFLPPNTEFVAPISISKVNIVKDQVVRNCFQ